MTPAVQVGQSHWRRNGAQGFQRQGQHPGPVVAEHQQAQAAQVVCQEPPAAVYVHAPPLPAQGSGFRD